MKKYSLLVLCFLLTLTCPNLSQASELTTPNVLKQITKKGQLRIGVKQDVPNFGYYHPKHRQFEGMEIDIAKKIAKALDVKPQFTAVTAQTREALLDNQQLDMIIATYTITPERQKQYAFSNPYYLDEIGFLVKKSDAITSIKELNQKTIGVAQGSTTKNAIEEYGKAHDLSFSFVQLGSYPELAISLYANRIASFSVDKSILSGYTNQKTTILTEGFNQQAYGVATTKSNKALITHINKLLEQWQKDGSLAKIYRKYGLIPATRKP
ncbi:transporter substrate-binding domain-containing protein [Streptococcus dysgalactiae]|uniref:transporter substrate-binding domain-containing protein n=1 Tax=Streptococcus dysgalactiae TaxID=1334 RepID=UPI0001F866AF|nr:transporter substrate-binding domain-containing protein [Streptococcus dysgalactiae]EFY02254.1 glutamine-binding protein precursor [Streptococcus dysgalactiae subsp. dysgalactiae ATCC 27957]MCB2830438.1 transporter substrate-binding domain-containing protein [Streptococcus dysgalactiae subsp. dysgalactiae]MCB2832299.1 transporter substrate-binding domain-containing protein [Streptococcus dysgalactiae subsp. dysgalactiae]MCB2836130.1 transporter substrate-binding domain-containing protein [St